MERMAGFFLLDKSKLCPHFTISQHNGIWNRLLNDIPYSIVCNSGLRLFYGVNSTELTHAGMDKIVSFTSNDHGDKHGESRDRLQPNSRIPLFWRFGWCVLSKLWKRAKRSMPFFLQDSLREVQRGRVLRSLNCWKPCTVPSIRLRRNATSSR